MDHPSRLTLGLFAVLPLMLLFFAAFPSTGNAHVGEKYTAVYAKNPVTIDGRWTSPDEWSDAYEMQLSPGRGEQANAVFRAKHDEKNLYLLIEFLSDTTIDYAQPGQSGAYRQDQVTFFFGIGHRGGQFLSGDDCFITTFWASQTSLNSLEACAVEGNWPSPNEVDHTGVEAASSLIASNSPHSSNHLIWEIRIPKVHAVDSTVIYDFRSSNSLGFSVVAYDNGKRVAAVFPQDRTNSNPSTWGDMELSTKPSVEAQKPMTTASLETEAFTTRSALEHNEEHVTSQVTHDSLYQYLPIVAVVCAIFAAVAVMKKQSFPGRRFLPRSTFA